MKIFIYDKQPDGTYQKRFYALSELETILAHKRVLRGKRLHTQDTELRKQPWQ